MEFLIIFKSSVLPLFILVAIAFVYYRIFRPDLQQITNLALIIFGPAFVYDALVKHRITMDMLIKPMVFMALLTSALMILAYLMARITRAGDDDRVSLILSSSMINVGNFGLPLIYFAYGHRAEVYSVLYFTAFNIPLSTIAIYISSKEKNIIKILGDVAKIPLFHAMIIAIIVSNLSIPVPAVINKSISLLGQAAIPLFIFILGMQLSKIRLKWRFFGNTLIGVGLRLVISPILAYVILKIMGVSGLERHVALVQTSAPSAILPLMYAIRFNRSPDLLAAIILITTLLSGISLTVIMKIIS